MGPLSLEEIKQAEVCLVSWAQRETFSEDIEKLLKTGSVGKRSKLLSLTPFLNVGGVVLFCELGVDYKILIYLSKANIQLCCHNVII